MENKSKHQFSNIQKEEDFNCALASKDCLDHERGAKRNLLKLTKFDIYWTKKRLKLYDSFEFCKCGFIAEDTLTEHCRRKGKQQLGSEAIKCTFCDLEFPCWQSKENHVVQEHIKGSMFQCSMCPHKTSKKEYLKIHRWIHFKKFSCETCQLKFTYLANLKHHQMQNNHGSFANNPVVKLKCNECDRSFATSIRLNEHKRKLHCLKSCQCDKCGKIFKNRDNIRIHLQVHFKIPCKVCHRLITKRCMESHMETHASEALECFCGKSFTSKRNLYQHNLSVHKVEIFKCPECDKIYKNRIAMTAHALTHKKIPCQICGKSFNKYLMKGHVQRSHAGKNYEELGDIKHEPEENFALFLPEELQIGITEKIEIVKREDETENFEWWNQSSSGIISRLSKARVEEVMKQKYLKQEVKDEKNFVLVLP